MYECDCTDGFELDPNGYSCRGKEIIKENVKKIKSKIITALNITFDLLNNNNNIVDSNRFDEDILYQKSMSFSAHLEGFNNLDAQNESGIVTNDSLIEKIMFIEEEIKTRSASSSVTIVNSSVSSQTTISYFDAAMG